VVAQYLAAMSEKDRAYQAREFTVEEARALPAPQEIVEEIPNIDHRFGDGKAEIIGIAVLNAQGVRVGLLQPNSTVVVRISVRAKENLDRPIVGFMFRNHLGVDFAGTNTARERQDLPPMLAGDVCTVDFYLDLPALYASSFSFSPAIANGSLEHYSMCDWINGDGGWNKVDDGRALGREPSYVAGRDRNRLHVEVLDPVRAAKLGQNVVELLPRIAGPRGDAEANVVEDLVRRKIASRPKPVTVSIEYGLSSRTTVSFGNASRARSSRV
jgi:hypothetical protein